MSVTPNLRLWSVVSNVSSIVFGLAKTDTKNKEVPSFYNFEQTVVVFRRSIAMVKDVQALLDTKDDINVINLGNFNGGGELEPVLEDIRKKQSKYALMSNPTDTKLTILLANII